MKYYPLNVYVKPGHLKKSLESKVDPEHKEKKFFARSLRIESKEDPF